MCFFSLRYSALPYWYFRIFINWLGGWGCWTRVSDKRHDSNAIFQVMKTTLNIILKYRYSVEYEVYKNQENVLFELLKIVNSDLI